MKFALRPDSYDDAILHEVFRGEYGALDVAGRTVVDIGAHIGAFAILAAREGARRVLAYEPGEENFRLLTINCASLPAIETYRAAAWRSDRDDATVDWRASSNARNTGGGAVVECTSIAGVPVDGTLRRPVRAIAFDDIVERAGTVGLLKIDAEGSEYPILCTSRKLDRVETIVGEYHDIDGLDERMSVPGLSKWTGEALMDLLDERGFDVASRPVGAVGLFRAVRRRP